MQINDWNLLNYTSAYQTTAETNTTAVTSNTSETEENLLENIAMVSSTNNEDTLTINGQEVGLFGTMNNTNSLTFMPNIGHNNESSNVPVSATLTTTWNVGTSIHVIPEWARTMSGGGRVSTTRTIKDDSAHRQAIYNYYNTTIGFTNYFYDTSTMFRFIRTIKGFEDAVEEDSNGMLSISRETLLKLTQIDTLEDTNKDFFGALYRAFQTNTYDTNSLKSVVDGETYGDRITFEQFNEFFKKATTVIVPDTTNKICDEAEFKKLVKDYSSQLEENFNEKVAAGNSTMSTVETKITQAAGKIKEAQDLETEANRLETEEIPKIDEKILSLRTKMIRLENMAERYSSLSNDYYNASDNYLQQSQNYRDIATEIYNMGWEEYYKSVHGHSYMQDAEPTSYWDVGNAYRRKAAEAQSEWQEAINYNNSMANTYSDYSANAFQRGTGYLYEEFQCKYGRFSLVNGEYINDPEGNYCYDGDSYLQITPQYSIYPTYLIDTHFGYLSPSVTNRIQEYEAEKAEIYGLINTKKSDASKARVDAQDLLDEAEELKQTAYQGALELAIDKTIEYLKMMGLTEQLTVLEQLMGKKLTNTSIVSKASDNKTIDSVNKYSVLASVGQITIRNLNEDSTDDGSTQLGGYSYQAYGLEYTNPNDGNYVNSVPVWAGDEDVVNSVYASDNGIALDIGLLDKTKDYGGIYNLVDTLVHELTHATARLYYDLHEDISLEYDGSFHLPGETTVYNPAEYAELTHIKAELPEVAKASNGAIKFNGENLKYNSKTIYADEENKLYYNDDYSNKQYITINGRELIFSGNRIKYAYTGKLAYVDAKINGTTVTYTGFNSNQSININGKISVKASESYKDTGVTSYKNVGFRVNNDGTYNYYTTSYEYEDISKGELTDITAYIRVTKIGNLYYWGGTGQPISVSSNDTNAYAVHNGILYVYNGDKDYGITLYTKSPNQFNNTYVEGLYKPVTLTMKEVVEKDADNKVISTSYVVDETKLPETLKDSFKGISELYRQVHATEIVEIKSAIYSNKTKGLNHTYTSDIYTTNYNASTKQITLTDADNNLITVSIVKGSDNKYKFSMDKNGVNESVRLYNLSSPVYLTKDGGRYKYSNGQYAPKYIETVQGYAMISSVGNGQYTYKLIQTELKAGYTFNAQDGKYFNSEGKEVSKLEATTIVYNSSNEPEVTETVVSFTMELDETTGNLKYKNFSVYNTSDDPSLFEVITETEYEIISYTETEYEKSYVYYEASVVESDPDHDYELDSATGKYRKIIENSFEGRAPKTDDNGDIITNTYYEISIIESGDIVAKSVNNITSKFMTVGDYEKVELHYVDDLDTPYWATEVQNVVDSDLVKDTSGLNYVMGYYVDSNGKYKVNGQGQPIKTRIDIIKDTAGKITGYHYPEYNETISAADFNKIKPSPIISNSAKASIFTEAESMMSQVNLKAVQKLMPNANVTQADIDELYSDFHKLQAFIERAYAYGIDFDQYEEYEDIQAELNRILLEKGKITEEEQYDYDFESLEKSYSMVIYLSYKTACIWGEYSAYQVDADYVDSIGGDELDGEEKFSIAVTGPDEKNTIMRHIQTLYNLASGENESRPEGKWYTFDKSGQKNKLSNAISIDYDTKFEKDPDTAGARPLDLIDDDEVGSSTGDNSSNSVSFLDSIKNLFNEYAQSLEDGTFEESDIPNTKAQHSGIIIDA